MRYPVEIAPVASLAIEGKPALIQIACKWPPAAVVSGSRFLTYISLRCLDWEFKNVTIPEFIGSFEKCRVGSLDDIIRFNEQHKDIAMPERKGTCAETDIIEMLTNKSQLSQNRTSSLQPMTITTSRRILPS